MATINVWRRETEGRAQTPSEVLIREDLKTRHWMI